MQLYIMMFSNINIYFKEFMVIDIRALVIMFLIIYLKIMKFSILLKQIATNGSTEVIFQFCLLRVYCLVIVCA